METYSLMREFADSIGLAAMFIVFVGAIAWAFRPGSARLHQDTAAIPFRNEDRPAPDHGDRRATAKDVRS